LNTLKHFIIPIFLPQAGCPYQCVFCDQHAITGERNAYPDIKTIEENINNYLSFNKHKNSYIQISFYGGNFLGLPKKKIIKYLECAQSFVDEKKVNSIRFSTRPDTVTDNRLKLIKKYAIKTIELGVQSMNDHVLKLAQRGHKSIDSYKATKLIRSEGYQIGHQIMIGLPGENEQTYEKSIDHVIKMHPDFVRLYPTLVLKSSILADWYLSGRYEPLSIKLAVKIAKKSLILFQSHNIKVIRMGLQTQENLENSILAGPFHPAFGHMVKSEYMLDCVKEKIQLSSSFNISILINPKFMSRLTGLEKNNLKRLKSFFPKKHIQVIPDPGIKVFSIFEH